MCVWSHYDVWQTHQNNDKDQSWAAKAGVTGLQMRFVREQPSVKFDRDVLHVLFV